MRPEPRGNDSELAILDQAALRSARRLRQLHGSSSGSWHWSVSEWGRRVGEPGLRINVIERW
jgi:hypothetical protein